MFRAVFSENVDPSYNWYAMNDDVCGCEVRKFYSLSVYKVIDSQIRKVNIQDLKTFDGHVVPIKWFASSGINNNKSRHQDVNVA